MNINISRVFFLRSLYLTLLGSSMAISMTSPALTNTGEQNFRNYASKSNFFSNFIFENNLHDLSFYGSCFTQCNARQGLTRRWARLDQFLANTVWLSIFKDFSNQHLPRTNSDHAPMFFSVQNPIIFSKNNFVSIIFGWTMMVVITVFLACLG